jgi:protoheme ferro-lyase
MSTRHVVLLTYGEPPTPDFVAQLRYSWRILLGLTRAVAPIPAAVLPLIALSRARLRWRLWTRESYGSPLERLTGDQRDGLLGVLREQAPDVAWRVHVAYEFRDPLLLDVLGALPADEPVDVVPMYVADSAFTHEISRRTIAEWKRFPEGRPAPVRVVPPIDEEAFAEVSARFVGREIAKRKSEGADWALLLAAHGTLLEPPRPMETGRLATERVYRAIARRLEGRFGAIANGWLNHVYGGRWTEPPVEDALRRLTDAGYRKLVYFPFGFSADNAESELEGRIALRVHPELSVVHLPCLNADREFLTLEARAIVEAGRAVESGRGEPMAAAHASKPGPARSTAAAVEV